jgi:C4-type Zn-finger protein
MNITKEECERILKSVQSNKVQSITLRKNDTNINKKQEFQSLVNTVNKKITGGKELTVILIETH